MKNNRLFKLSLFIYFAFIFKVHNACGQFLDLETFAGMEAQGDAAARAGGFLSTYGEGVGSIIAAVIEAFLGLLGVIFVILIILAGYKWMMARGNEEQVKEAQEQIRRAIIGLLIVISAYAITYFVFKYLPWGTGGGGGGLGTSP